MALRIVSDEWVREMERELACANETLKNMTKAHANAVQSYRELRDSKDSEILNLHTEIEALKQDKEKLRTENARLRQMVKWHENNRKTAV